MDTWFLVQQATGEWAKIKAFLSGGLYAPYTTTATPDSFITLASANGEFVRIATVLLDGVHTICVVNA